MNKVDQMLRSLINESLSGNGYKSIKEHINPISGEEDLYPDEDDEEGPNRNSDDTELITQESIDLMTKALDSVYMDLTEGGWSNNQIKEYVIGWVNNHL